jgi:2-keto-4-pentenoate hydratase/2-oxohepta-3-ene-1,7-dioic acid hydratase in catechol pathway
MKFVRYDRNGAVRVGLLDGEQVYDLLDAAPTGTPPALLAAFADATKLVAAGDEGLTAARAALANAKKGGGTPLAKVRLKAPIEPTLILCSGENYWDHREEKPEVTRKDPEFSSRPRSASSARKTTSCAMSG